MSVFNCVLPYHPHQTRWDKILQKTDNMNVNDLESNCRDSAKPFVEIYHADVWHRFDVNESFDFICSVDWISIPLSIDRITSSLWSFRNQHFPLFYVWDFHHSSNCSFLHYNEISPHNHSFFSNCWIKPANMHVIWVDPKDSWQALFQIILQLLKVNLNEKRPHVFVLARPMQTLSIYIASPRF